MSKNIFFITSLLLFVELAYADGVMPLTIMSAQPKTHHVIRGQLKAREFTIISAGLSGKLIKFSVDSGQIITKGDKLAVFKCKIESAEKDIAEAKLNAARNKLSANVELKKYNNISHLDVSLSKAEVAIQSAELKRAKAILSECTIVAPFSGIVVEKFVQAYQYIKQGDPLLELVNTANLEVEMVIPSKWLEKVSINTDISIMFDELSTSVKAKISRNMGVIDPVSQTIRVVAQLKSPSKQLLPGMSGEVSFTKTELMDKVVSDLDGAH